MKVDIDIRSMKNEDLINVARSGNRLSKDEPLSLGGEAESRREVAMLVSMLAELVDKLERKVDTNFHMQSSRMESIERSYRDLRAQVARIS